MLKQKRKHPKYYIKAINNNAVKYSKYKGLSI